MASAHVIRAEAQQPPVASERSEVRREDNIEGQLQSKVQTTSKIKFWQLIFRFAIITPEVYANEYDGHGTDNDPFVVDFLPGDPLNPHNWATWRKWLMLSVTALSTLGVSFCTSAYLSALPQLRDHFQVSDLVITLGLSLFILGFALGPLAWGPLSEEYGRQPLFFFTYMILTAFNIGVATSNSMTTILVLRFFAGAFGASPLTNSGGVIADLFIVEERAVGIAAWAACAFIGPAVGPIVSNFVAAEAGWRWVMWVMTFFAGVMWVLGTLFVPETYSPVILRRRAQKLTSMTGKLHVSVYEKAAGSKATAMDKLRKVLLRPWAFLIYEPIVLLISVYMAILYATMFLLLAAFPIVFSETRGWAQGVSGLPFIAMIIGIFGGALHTVYDNKRYLKAIAKPDNEVPEARLPPALLGAIVTPLGMFLFAWTNFPSIHWIVCLIGIFIFCHASVLVFLSCTNYLIDSYTIYAASVLAANTLLRAVLAAAFPLFTKQMYRNLNIHWASSIPAFLALACLPAPFIFHKYGKDIRLKCRYAAQAYEYGQIQRNVQKSKAAAVEVDTGIVKETA